MNEIYKETLENMDSPERKSIAEIHVRPSEHFSSDQAEGVYGRLMEKAGLSEAEGEKSEQRIPRNGGRWFGEPGNSEWVPDEKIVPEDQNGTNPEKKNWGEIKSQYQFEAIPFEKNRPDFSEVAKGEVQISDFTDNRRRNFVQADEKLAETRGCTPGEVRHWRTENRYTWHEGADCVTMQKVPTEVHGNIPHRGGISEYRERNAVGKGEAL